MSSVILSQIQDRVLPIGATINGAKIADDSTRVPLYLGTDSWWTLDLNGGLSLGERSRLNFGLSNLLDKNYRLHGSGIDAGGINAFLGMRYMF
jgi:hemoglobin/transferrin/lactoferrin receptor protein